MQSFKRCRLTSVSFVLCLSLGTSTLASTANAQSKTDATPQEPEACAKLRSDYEETSKKLALNDAKGRFDDSAIRTTMRETENSNAINQSRMIFEIMKTNGCQLPDHIPSSTRYALASTKCAVAREVRRAEEFMDRDRGNYVDRGPIEECDISGWKPDQK
ncbi:hypothetical protein [Sphingosinicella sp.]|uniref:hypothetical protein n=1 Tax=Sphingosinicella sp. TaxID=1917971 RepID=UPI0035B448EB